MYAADTKNLILTQKNNVSTEAHKLTLKLPYPYRARNGDSIAIDKLFIYKSWFNITSRFGNNAFSYVWTDGSTNAVNLPDGNYEIADIDGFLRYTMKINGHYLVDDKGAEVYYLSLILNSIYYAVTVVATTIPSSLPAGWSNPGGITLNGKCPQLVVGSNSFGTIVGFAPGTIIPSANTVSASTNSTTVPQVSPVTSISVSCNWVNNSYFSDNPSVVATFQTGNTPQGASFVLNDTNKNFFLIVAGQLPDITITFFDQDGNPLGIVDRNIVVSLLIKSQGQAQ